MKKSIYGLCALALFALALTSNSFDNAAFTADTVAAVVAPTLQSDLSMDGRNSATISVNGTSSSISGSGTISVTSEGGTGSASVTTTTGGGTTGNPTFTSSSTTSSTTTSSSSSTTTTSGGFNICDYITSPYFRQRLGCDG